MSAFPTAVSSELESVLLRSDEQKDLRRQLHHESTGIGSIGHKNEDEMESQGHLPVWYGAGPGGGGS